LLICSSILGFSELIPSIPASSNARVGEIVHFPFEAVVERVAESSNGPLMKLKYVFPQVFAQGCRYEITPNFLKPRLFPKEK
jgi:hypothetical protein